jgi:hypothetical protein
MRRHLLTLGKVAQGLIENCEMVHTPKRIYIKRASVFHPRRPYRLRHRWARRSLQFAEDEVVTINFPRVRILKAIRAKIWPDPMREPLPPKQYARHGQPRDKDGADLEGKRLEFSCTNRR